MDKLFLAEVMGWLVLEWKVPEEALQDFTARYLDEMVEMNVAIESWRNLDSPKYAIAARTLHKMIAEEIGESNDLKRWNWTSVGMRQARRSWKEKLEDEREAIPRRNKRASRYQQKSKQRLGLPQENTIKKIPSRVIPLRVFLLEKGLNKYIDNIE